MSAEPFIHLHVHSAFSLSEGALRIPELVAQCQKYKMPAVAITDSNNMFGALEFAAACAEGGIQPIIGCQIDLNFEQKKRMGVHAAPKCEPIVLIAQNEKGYGGLLKMVSHAYLAGEPGDPPFIDRAILRQQSEGVICLTGGLKGPVAAALAEGQNQEAEEKLLALKDIFGDRLYVEIQRHHLPAQNKIEDTLIDLAYQHNIPLVATNNCFFPEKDMYEAHDVLMANAQGMTISNDARYRLTPDHYFKTSSEMRELFKDLPEALANTIVIAKRCSFMPESRAPILPPYPVEKGESEAEELRVQAKEGLAERLKDYPEDGKPTYFDRLDFELDVIEKMGFPGYFLIVSDFMKWSIAHDIPVGPGRGSGAGSVVAWALKITNLDPLKFGLLFERFLNPERVSMPDFDIDFCQERRDEVIQYVAQKYGKDHVAQIITFGKLQARAVLRDVGRVYEMPYGQVDRICKMVPNNPAAPVTLQQAIDGDKDMQEMRDDEEDVSRLLDTALKLEGLYRHASTHAAGVVIGDRPLDELVPLYRDPKSEMPVTQFDMKRVEKAGLVKFDFLGLKTLTVLKKAVDMLAARGVQIDLDALPLDDKETYAMLARGETTGVFQLESAGMRDVLKKLNIDRFEDIIAVVALYRPGPMDNIPSFIRRKHGDEESDYLHPKLEDILTETYGIMIYQEQVMQAAQILAGYTLGSADLLRRAMGKKIKKEMDDQRKMFVDGAGENDVPAKKADEIFDQIAKFAGYGFNKSHAAAYAMVSYQTAYLKANYPVEFMAALMTLDMGNTDKLNIFRQELDRLKIPLMLPSVNKSLVEFGVEETEDGASGIRYALGAIKGAGAAAMESIVRERLDNGSFKDAQDLAARLDSKALGKRQMEALCYAGAFDELNPSRGSVLHSVEKILGHANHLAEERASNQNNLFGDGMAGSSVNFDWAGVPDMKSSEKLTKEFEAIGFYLSAHPLDAFQPVLKQLGVSSIAELTEEVINGELRRAKVAGVVNSVRERTSARGNKFAFAAMSDASGAYEITVFSDTLSQGRDLLHSTKPLLLTVDPQRGESEDELRFVCQNIQDLEVLSGNTGSNIKIEIQDVSVFKQVADLLTAEGKGPSEVMIHLPVNNQHVEVDLGQRFRLSAEALASLQNLDGLTVDVL